jgi:molecular chaperone DnaK (HSP70)
LAAAPSRILKEAERHGPDKIVGIDPGTTNSVVAIMEGGEPTVIASSRGGPACILGQDMLPILYFRPDYGSGGRSVGGLQG